MRQVVFLRTSQSLLLAALLLSCGPPSDDEQRSEQGAAATGETGETGEKKVALSAANATWREITGSPSYGGTTLHSSVVFEDKIYILGGKKEGSPAVYHNDIWSSADGESWEQVSTTNIWPARGEHSSVVFDDKIWVLGGKGPAPSGRGSASYEDVWSSADGATWTQVNVSGTKWAARHDHSSVIFKNKVWVLGGFQDSPEKRYNDVWASADGENWTEVSAQGKTTDIWPARKEHSSVVFQDKIWVFGGLSRDASRQRVYYNDVWVSSDGENWQQLSTQAESWTQRSGHNSVVLDDQIWLLGGTDNSSKLNDVWASNDGKNWQRASSPDSWPKRESQSSVVFQGDIWVLGGNSYIYPNSTYYNDIWRSAPGS